MQPLPDTRATLLARLGDPTDGDAWREFTRLYAGVVYGFARRRGLQDADAADLMQDVLRSIAGHVGRLEYDPARGRFRNWLFTVTRNKLYTFLDGQRRRVRATGDPETRDRLETVEAPSDGTDEWDREYERQRFAMAAEQVRGEFTASTWKAFWGTAVDGRPPKEVGAELKLSPGAVYVAKSRVLARLRDKVREMDDE
jgi:RNA polymerase sigma-70 factor (ECF subfamily)